METYPYPTPEGILDLVRKSEYDRLKWDLEEQKASHAADVAELNERLTKQHADMLDTIVQLRRQLTNIQSVINQLYVETDCYADGAPDATAHDKLCNKISYMLSPFIS